MMALATGLSVGLGALAMPTVASAGGGCWNCAPAVYGGPVYYAPRYYPPTYYAPNYYPAYWAPVYSPYLVGARPPVVAPVVAPVVGPVVGYGPVWRPSTFGGGYWRDPYWNWRRW
jgi:hypothetical protein